LENQIRINLLKVFSVTAILPFLKWGSEFFLYLRSESPATLSSEGRKHLDKCFDDLRFYNYDGAYRRGIDELISFVSEKRYETGADVDLTADVAVLQSYYLEDNKAPSSRDRQEAIEYASKVAQLIRRIREMNDLSYDTTQEEIDSFLSLR